jgi:transcription elongation factor GreA
MKKLKHFLGDTMKKYPMTIEGEQALKDELENLKRVERPEVIQAIAEARAHGDLKENAEYHAAREKQGFIEARIADIDGRLSTAQVIDIATLPQTGRVVFGCTVELMNLDTDATVEYRIVGEDEASVKLGKISVTSPIAKALIGKEEGECVDIITPGGDVSYEISEVKYI